MEQLNLKVKRIRAYDTKGLPKYEEFTVKLYPEATIDKYIKLLPNQNFLEVTVTDVLIQNPKNKKKLDLISDKNQIKAYQRKIDEVLEPKKEEKSPDYKDLYLKQKEENESILKRLESLENKTQESKDKEDIEEEQPQNKNQQSNANKAG